MKPFIENIEIKNFKSIQHQKIEGCKKINVFIGYPNVGKSNILEAISSMGVLSKEVTNGFDFNAYCRFEEPNELFFNYNIDSLATIQYSNLFRIAISSNLDNKANISVQYLDINDDWKNMSNYSSEETHIGVNQVISNEKLNVFKYDFSKTSTKNLSDYVSRSLLPPNGKNLFKIIESNADLRKQMVDLLSSYGLKLMFEKSGQYTLKVMKVLEDDTIVSIPFHQIADTLQRLIFYKAAIYTNENAVLLFEEPEAHMFPPYIRKFTSDVIFDKTNQFFIATHSPYVLDEFIEEASEDVAVFLVDYKQGETIIKSLSNEDLLEIRAYGVDLFFNLENYLNNDRQVDNA